MDTQRTGKETSGGEGQGGQGLSVRWPQGEQGGAQVHRAAAGSFGPSHKMAAAPLGPSVRDRGAGGRCSRPRRRRQPRTQGQGGQAREGKTDCRKLEDRKEERVSAGRPRTLKSSRRRVKPGRGLSGGGRSGGSAGQYNGAARPLRTAAVTAARGPPGSLEDAGRERASARTRGRAARCRGGRGFLLQQRSPAPRTLCLRSERPEGRHPVRWARGRAAGAASFWCLGRPEERCQATAG